MIKGNQQLSPENYIRKKARNLPIDKCLINSNWKEEGLAQIIVSRRHTNGNLTTGIYMVDLLCLGIRDSFCSFNKPESEFQEFIGNISSDFEMIVADYILVHNIIYSAIAYAEDLGFKPHKEFNTLSKYILEEDDEKVELIDIECGMDGKPAFIHTDSFTDAQANSIINQLKKSVGEGNYTLISEQPDYKDSGYEDEFYTDYDDEDEWDESRNFRLFEIESLSPQARKIKFLKLASIDMGELEEDEFEDLILVCDFIFMNDISNQELTEQYYDQWSREYFTEISDGDFTHEALGIKPGTYNKTELKQLNLEILKLKTSGRITRKKVQDIQKKRGTIPYLVYLEFLNNDTDTPEKRLQEVEKLIATHPDYSLLKFELIKLKIQLHQEIELPGFDQYFGNRDSVTSLEMTEFQLTKILSMAVLSDDRFNQLNAQSMIVEVLELPEEYLSVIRTVLNITKINALAGYWHDELYDHATKTFQFHIQLVGVANPPVWRRILMPSDATFDQLHDAIQISFGWESEHMYHFSPNGTHSTPYIEPLNEKPFDISTPGTLDANTLTLDQIFKAENDSCTYLYDFGDNWEHTLTLEMIIDERIHSPELTNGGGACPPENCGGAPGYEELKKVMANKKHPEHKEMKSWLGLEGNQKWDAHEFNLEEYQETLADLTGDV